MLSENNVRAGAAFSKGYPDSVFILADGADAEGINDCCNYQNEHVNPRLLLEARRFQKAALEHGELHAKDCGEGGDRAVYYTLCSQTSRKREENALSLSDPTAETFLDLSGAGDFSMLVNRKLAATGDLADGTVTAAEIGIENGFNHVLVRLRHEPNDALRMQRRNIMYEAETGFRF